MPFCRACGRSHTLGWAFCGACGHPTADPGPPADAAQSVTSGPSPSLADPTVVLPSPTKPLDGTKVQAGHDERVGPYRIVGKIGAGATGTVYLAHHDDLHRDVAIKRLAARLYDDQRFRDRFAKEAQTMAELNSPHCVAVYDYIDTGTTAFVVMERVEGASLRHVMNRAGRLTPEQALGVLDGALRGLSDAHQAGLVHGDIKPENILVDQDGLSKLADFGLSRQSGQASSAGTLAYMSPEQIRSEQVDHRSDIYAAGVLLYELLGRRTPFTGQSSAEVVANVLHQPAPPLVGQAASVNKLLSKALAKQSDERHQTAAEFLADLRRAASDAYGPSWADRSSLAGLVGVLVGGAGGAALTVGAHATGPAWAGTAAQASGASIPGQGALLAPGASIPSSISAVGARRVAAGLGRRQRIVAAIASHKLVAVAVASVVAATSGGGAYLEVVHPFGSHRTVSVDSTHARADAVQACQTYVATYSIPSSESIPQFQRAASQAMTAASLDDSWAPLAKAMADFATLPENFLTPAQGVEDVSDSNTIHQYCGPLGIPLSFAVAPTTTTVKPDFSGLMGRYTGSTGGSGQLYVGGDGASRFTGEDLTACSKPCVTATAPQETIDFTLTSVTASADPGVYEATGPIAAESDPTDARTFAGPVGTAVKVSLIPPGILAVSFLGPSDHLCKLYGGSGAPGCF